MAKGFNKVILMGNLTRDPETRTTPNGQSVTNFSLAVNRTWKGQDGQTQEAVSYIDCVAWGRTGEVIAQYMQKGRPILVSGRLDQRSWEQDGNKRSKVEVIVEDFNFVGGGDGGSGGGSYASSSADSSSASASSKSSNDKADDVVIEDIDDKPIDLSEIPF
jgi:single-strand DNA-binding protein